MKKQIVRLTEGDLHSIIENTVKRVLKEGMGNEMSEVVSRDNYDSDRAYEFDRVSDIQEVKAELGDFIENKIYEYHLNKDEVMKVLNTMIKYFSTYQY